MKVKLDGRVRRICNRVDEEHAEWLLDHKMDLAYLRITRKRRGGLMGIIVLVMAFVVLIWAFTYTTGFKTLFVATAGIISLVIAVFILSEMRAVTVHDRMKSLIHEVELERPIVSPEPHPSLVRLDEVAALAGEAEPERGRVAIHAAAEPAPTRSSARPAPPPEDGIPGIPQPVVSPDEWQVMTVGEPARPATTQAPAQPPVQTPAQPPAQAPGIPPPAVPTPALIEELPDEAAPAPPSAPLSPPVPPRVPPPAQPAPQYAPQPPQQAPPTAPAPPRPVVQAPPPSPAPPATPPGPPPMRPQAPQPPQPPQRPRPQAEEEEVEEAEWVDWE